MEERNTTPDDAKKRLFLQQKELLDTFLSNGAITRAQYEKSLNGLAEKMGFETLLRSD